jgi:hypothetical protein
VGGNDEIMMGVMVDGNSHVMGVAVIYGWTIRVIMATMYAVVGDDGRNDGSRSLRSKYEIKSCQTLLHMK